MLFQPTRVRLESELYYKSGSNVRLCEINHAFSTNWSARCI